MERIAATNIDTGLIIRTYVARFREQYISPLESQRSKKETESRALASIFTYVSDLKTKLTPLLGSAFLLRVAVSSNTNVLVAAADSTALSATYNVHVSQLASQHKVGSGQFSNSGTEIITTEGPGDKTFRITINGIDTDIRVSLVAGENNRSILQKMALAINSSEAKATAIVVQETPTTSRLVITAKETGLTNKMSFQDISGTLLQTTQIIDAGGNILHELQEAKDALFTIDTLSFQRSSNIISDALPGVTLQLKGIGNSTLTVSPDTKAIQERIQDFINSYNTLVSYTRTQTSYDIKTKTSGSLFHSPFSRNLPHQLRPLVGYPVSGLPPAFNSLARIGIDTNKEGLLSIKDSGRLINALNTNLAEVERIFNTPNGIAVRLKNYLNEITSPGGGLAIARNTLDTQIRRLREDIAAKERSLEVYRAGLIRQFSALESLLATNQKILNTFRNISLIPSFR